MRTSTLWCMMLASGAVALSACASEPAPDKIRIGQAVSQTGPMASVADATSNPAYSMWIEDVNANGGIYIAEYAKKLPIELIRYDDESDSNKMKIQLERLMLQDRVNFVLAPISTAFLLEAAPLVNKYGYILMGGPGGAVKLKEIIAGLPYLFSVLNFGDTQMPVLAQILHEVGVKRVAVLFVDEQHGYEYFGVLAPMLAPLGIDIVLARSYPFNSPDVAATVENTMKEADAMQADAFISFSYPDATLPAPAIAMKLGYRPKLMHLNVGSSWGAFRDMYGARAVEGIMGPGAWNAKSSEAARQFEQRFVARWSAAIIDYWAMLLFYAGCEFFQHAIEKAGSLDQNKIREIMATETFDTVAGPMKFEHGLNVTHPGEMGQWQNGVFEVIGPADKRTAAPQYPKPDWPPAAPVP